MIELIFITVFVIGIALGLWQGYCHNVGEVKMLEVRRAKAFKDAEKYYEIAHKSGLDNIALRAQVSLLLKKWDLDDDDELIMEDDDDELLDELNQGDDVEEEPKKVSKEVKEHVFDAFYERRQAKKLEKEIVQIYKTVTKGKK